MMDFIHRNIISHFGKKIIFPFYHIVSDEDCPHVKNLYPIKRIKEFEKELDFLQQHYHPINLEELTNYINNNTEPSKPSFFLSFDDGLKECYDVIAPILLKREISAAFFINSGFVNNQDLFYRYKISLIIEKIINQNISYSLSINELLNLQYADIPKIESIAQDLKINFDDFLLNEKPYMDWVEINELKNQGFYIGGHSIDHPYYYQISLEEQINQTTNSVNTVVDKLNLDYRIFSFPFTDFQVSHSFFNEVYTNKVCDFTFGTAGIKDDEIRKNIQRISMDKLNESINHYFTKNQVLYFLKKLLNKNSVIHPKK